MEKSIKEQLESKHPQLMIDVYSRKAIIDFFKKNNDPRDNYVIEDEITVNGINYIIDANFEIHFIYSNSIGDHYTPASSDITGCEIISYEIKVISGQDNSEVKLCFDFDNLEKEIKDLLT